MKAFLIVLICVLSACQGAAITKGDNVTDALINNSPVAIPAITEITTPVTSTKDISTKSSESTSTSKIPPQPPVTSDKPPHTTLPPPTTPTSTTTSKPTTTVAPPPITNATTTTPKPSTTHSTTIKPSPTTTSTTVKPTSSPSTEPIVSTTPASAPSNRGFDGPSFIGGIVLASGLMAIGFVALKFYRARTELNYHTL